MGCVYPLLYGGHTTALDSRSMIDSLAHMKKSHHDGLACSESSVLAGWDVLTEGRFLDHENVESSSQCQLVHDSLI